MIDTLALRAAGTDNLFNTVTPGSIEVITSTNIGIEQIGQSVRSSHSNLLRVCCSHFGWSRPEEEVNQYDRAEGKYQGKELVK